MTLLSFSAVPILGAYLFQNALLYYPDTYSLEALQNRVKNSRVSLWPAANEDYRGLIAGADLAEARVEVAKPSKHHRSGFVYYAEVNLKIGSRLFRAVAEHLDLHTAIDLARDEIERQIKEYKERSREARRTEKNI